MIVMGPPDQTAHVVRRVLRHPEYRINVVACVDTAYVDRFDRRDRAEARAMDGRRTDDPRAMSQSCPS